MRKVVVYLLAYPLYWLGCVCSSIMGGFGFASVYGGWWTHIFYRPYNFFMTRSCAIEEWAGTEIIWKKVTE